MRDNSKNDLILIFIIWICLGEILNKVLALCGHKAKNNFNQIRNEKNK